MDQALQQRSVEVTALGKAALFEASQKLTRETTAATAELRVRLDETAERLGSELREGQAGLHTKMNDMQGELRGQLAADRHTAQTLVTESIRQQDDHLREAQAATE